MMVIAVPGMIHVVKVIVVYILARPVVMVLVARLVTAATMKYVVIRTNTVVQIQEIIVVRVSQLVVKVNVVVLMRFVVNLDANPNAKIHPQLESVTTNTISRVSDARLLVETTLQRTTQVMKSSKTVQEAVPVIVVIETFFATQNITVTVGYGHVGGVKTTLVDHEEKLVTRVIVCLDA